MSESIVSLPKWTKKFMPPAPYKIVHGGRGEGAKSESVATVLLLKVAAHPGARVVCGREFQKSTKESVLATLKAVAERMGIAHKFTYTENTFRGRAGQEFIFIGLHANVAAIKSLHGIDYCWIEEAETVSEESWRVLLPTLRKNSTELYVSFNPRDEEDATSVRWIKNPPPNAVVVKVTHEDNPFLPEIMRMQIAHDVAKDPEMAAHVWFGEYRKNSEAQIFKGRYRAEVFEVPEIKPEMNVAQRNAVSQAAKEWSGPYYGLDFGFAKDPLSAHEYWVKGNTLYVYRESWGCGVELNDIPAKLRRDMPRLGTKLIRADNSRPESISHLVGLGLNAVACAKWPGCVEDGIAYLRSLDGIVIHSTNCPEAVREARYYSYEVHKTAVDSQGHPIVLPKAKDAWNHFWDDCRYACEPAILAAEHQITVTHEPQEFSRGITPELDEIDNLPYVAFL